MKKYTSRILLMTALIFIFSISVMSAVLGALNDNISVIIIGTISAVINAGFGIAPLINKFIELNKIYRKLEITAFTDRETELKEVCKILLEWGKDTVCKPIKIEREGKASGETYFLLKIWHTAISYFQFCKAVDLKLGFTSFLKWIRINKIKYVDCSNDEEAKKIYSKILYKKRATKTIYIFDKLPETKYIDILKRKDVYRFIYSGDLNIDIKYEPVKLHEFKAPDVKSFYYNLKQADDEVHGKISGNKNPDNRHLISLYDNELDDLCKLVSGDIKVIRRALYNKENEKFLRGIKISNNVYEKILQSAEFKMKIGSYQEALDELEENKLEFESLVEMQLVFRFNLDIAHCKHLLNNYDEAIGILDWLKYDFENKNILNKYNIANIIELRFAHYYKHKGDFDSAIRFLNINSIQAKLDFLGIYAAQYFLEGTGDKEFCANYSALNSMPLEDDNLAKLNRYSPIYYLLNYNEINITKLYECIKYYEKDGNHLVANARFLMAEANRLSKQFSDIKKQYLNCLDYADDFNDINLKIQVCMMIRYLCSQKVIRLSSYENERVLSLNNIKNMAREYKMEYNLKCASMINSIDLKDPGSETVKQNIDTRYFVIL